MLRMTNLISAIVLTYNSESDIADCLESVGFCGEIVVIDGGSSDRTVEIVKRMGANVYQLITDDFSEKRIEGLKRARCEWLMYVDSDERVTPSLRDGIIKCATNPIEEYSGYRIKRKNFYLGKHEWPKIEQLERLFLKKKLKGWRGALHESAIVDGEIGELDGFIEHYTHKDLRSMLEKTIKWSEVEARLRYEAGHPKMTWWRFPRVMIGAFWDYYIVQEGWRVGTAGLIESIYQAFSMFVTYARLREMQEDCKNQKLNIKNTYKK